MSSYMKFKKKPVVIEAIQYVGYNTYEVFRFANFENIDLAPKLPDQEYPDILVTTLEGIHRADVNDWIIRGVKGEIYPCKPDIFEMTYERVE